MDCSPPGSSVPGILHKISGVGCHAIPRSGLNPHLLCLSHCRQSLYHCAPGEMVQIPGNSNFSWLQALLDLGSGDVTDTMYSLCLHLFFFSASFSASGSLGSEALSKIVDFYPEDNNSLQISCFSRWVG